MQTTEATGEFQPVPELLVPEPDALVPEPELLEPERHLGLPVFLTAAESSVFVEGSVFTEPDEQDEPSTEPRE